MVGSKYLTKKQPNYRILSTCPVGVTDDPPSYLKRVLDVTRWSDEAGCEGMLIYTDNRLLDPWQLAQFVLNNSDNVAPLIAVQPIYMHPYSAATMVSSLAMLTGRRVLLNMVAGGFTNDLHRLSDFTAHDERYTRLVEYTTILTRLLRGEVVSHNGSYYRVDKLQLSPKLDPDLMPEVFVSGSSAAGTNAARAANATVVRYPGPASEDQGVLSEEGLRGGIRIGVIARPSDEEAWSVATARFPADRSGQIAHELAMRASDSAWHAQLSEMARTSIGTYWLWPFQTYKTFCPYLVGSYDQVAGEIARYLALGYETFILDVPTDAEELLHARRAFEQAVLKI